MNQLKQQLQKATQQAIAAAKQASATLAQKVFASALEKLRIEVCAGRKFAVVMSLTEGTDYTTGSVARNSQVLNPANLIGTAASIYQQFAGFRRTLQYWSRMAGCFRDDYEIHGFNIVLEWTDADELIGQIEKLGPGNNAAAIRQAIRDIEQEVADKAKQIVAHFAKAAHAQANAEKRWAIMMSLSPGVDYIRPDGCTLRAEAFDPAWLGPVAQTVFDACEGFNTAFEFWSKMEGCGRDDYEIHGFNLVVRW